MMQNISSTDQTGVSENQNSVALTPQDREYLIAKLAEILVADFNQTGSRHAMSRKEG